MNESSLMVKLLKKFRVRQRMGHTVFRFIDTLNIPSPTAVNKEWRYTGVYI